jgi:hypothetical protein
VLARLHLQAEQAAFNMDTSSFHAGDVVVAIMCLSAALEPNSHCLTGKASNPSICIATTAYAKKELAGY